MNWLGLLQDVDASSMRIRRPFVRRDAAHEHLDALWAQSPVGVFQTDARGRYISVNPKWCELTGLAPDDAYGDGWTSAVHPDDRERITVAWMGSAARGREFSADYRYLRPDGTVSLVNGHARTLRSAGGAVLGFLGTVTDVTEQRAAEQAQARTERESQELLRSVPVGVFKSSVDGTWAFANEKFAEILGVPHGDAAAVAEAYVRSVHPRDRTLLLGDGDHLRLDGGDVEHRIVRPGGEVRAVILRCVASRLDPRDATSRIVSFHGTLIDVTDRRLAEAALRSSEEMFRTLAVSIPVGVAHRDETGKVTFVNAELRRIVGVGPDVDPAEFDSHLIHEDDRADAEAAMRRTMATGEPYERDLRFVRPSGEHRWVTIRGALQTGDDGAFGGYLITCVDITDRHLAEVGRRHADEQFRVAFEQAPIGIGVVGMHGRFERVNDAFTAITGYTAEEMCAHAPYTIVAEPDRAEAQEHFQALIAHEVDSASMQFRMAHKDDHEIWAEARITMIVDEDGRPDEILMQVQDVSERRQYEQRLKHMAHHDPLTGLVNRRGLERELDLQLARVRRYDTGGALLLLDLDGFKAVNDGHGHAVGDALLVGVAGALTERLR
ncbi:MAG: PAS domain S-box protein, partial [Solirubrobacteraceae bacterium]|nr:PAS domain S-box protein [Solirubrobacteraceae bacterium]